MKQSLLFLICLIAISTSSFGNPAIAPPRDAPLPIGITITLVDDVSCHGESDGSATILVTDLALLTSYSYEIKNSADEVIQSGDQALLANLISNLLDLNLGLTIRAENLPADTYTFSWTTYPLLPLGSPVIQSTNFTVDEPDALEIIDLNVDDILSCIDPTGSIEIITSGGSGGLLGILNLGEILNLGQNGNTITDLTEGIYSIIVEDENGCRDTASAEVKSLIQLPNLNITGGLEIGCHEFINLGVSSESGVELKVDVPGLNNEVEILGQSFQVTTPGIYKFTALDPLTGCVSEEEVEVTANIQIPLVDAGTDRILGCLDNLGLEAVTDATNIVWENLSGNVLSSNHVLQVDAPGTYVAVATDAITGCVGRDTVVVSPGNKPLLSFEAGVTYDLGCLNVADLAIINNEGITLNFSRLGGVGQIIAGNDNKLTIGAPGTYIASGVDLVTQCLVADTITVTANVTIGAIEIEEDTAYLDCDGTAVITADDTDLGLGANVQILWEVIEGDVLIDEDGTTATVQGVGTVAVIATDLIKECTSSDTIVIVNPGDVDATAQITNELCAGANNGAIDLTVQAGLAPYTYSWSNGATTQDIANLAPGEYTVVITDSRGCEGEFTFTVEEAEAPNLSVNITTEGDSSYTVQAVVEGGNPPFTYSWSNGSTDPSIVVGAGDYSLTVTDANECPYTLDFQVPTDPDEEDPDDEDPDDEDPDDEDPDDEDPDDEDPTDSCELVLNFDVTLVVDSADGAVEVVVTGGVEPYTYVWSTGDSTAMITGLTVGTYEVTITDSVGCSTTAEVDVDQDPDGDGPDGCPRDIVVDQCQSIVYYETPNIISDLEYTITQIEGLCSGSVFPIGTTRITYLIIYENGEYELCSFNIVVLPVDIDLDITHPTCFDGTDGQVVINVPEPEKNYYLFWNQTPIQKGDTLTDLAAGTYHLIGMDDSGCIINKDVVLEQPDSLFLVEGLIVNSNDSLADGQVQITVHGGTYPYTYEWQGPDGFSSSQEDIYNVENGEYTLTVIDANGCSLIAGPFILEGEDSEVVASEFPKIERAFIADRVKMFPNPSEGMVSFEVTLDNQSDIQVSIYDNIGKMVKLITFENILDSTIDLNLADLKKGTYFINIQTRQGILTKTITLF